MLLGAIMRRRAVIRFDSAGMPALRRLSVTKSSWLRPATTEWPWTSAGRLKSARFGDSGYPQHDQSGPARRKRAHPDFCALDMDYYSADPCGPQVFDPAFPDETSTRLVLSADDIFGLHDVIVHVRGVGEDAHSSFNQNPPCQRSLADSRTKVTRDLVPPMERP